MKVWTFQPLKVQEKLNKGETHYCNPELSSLLSDDDWKQIFQPAYSYMIEQMNSRKIDKLIHESHYPIWAWVKEDGLNKKPDLRKHSYTDNSFVLIEAEINNNRILLSDFVEWHNVLNNCAIVEEQDETVDNFSQNEIRETWENIFNVNESKYVQGCFWELRPEDVVKYYPINRQPKSERA